MIHDTLTPRAVKVWQKTTSLFAIVCQKPVILIQPNITSTKVDSQTNLNRLAKRGYM